MDSGLDAHVREARRRGWVHPALSYRADPALAATTAAAAAAAAQSTSVRSSNGSTSASSGASSSCGGTGEAPGRLWIQDMWPYWLDRDQAVRNYYDATQVPLLDGWLYACVPVLSASLCIFVGHILLPESLQGDPGAGASACLPACLPGCLAVRAGDVPADGAQHGGQEHRPAQHGCGSAAGGLRADGPSLPGHW